MLSVEKQEQLILNYLPWHEVDESRCIIRYATSQYSKFFKKMVAMVRKESYNPSADHCPGSPSGYSEVTGSHIPNDTISDELADIMRKHHAMVLVR